MKRTLLAISDEKGRKNNLSNCPDAQKVTED